MKHQLSQPVILFTGALVAVIALGVIFHSPIDRQLRSWKLLPEPERLTELYFTNPNSLPTHYVPGHAQPVSFTVHNLEYRTTNYQYRIVETSQDGKQSQALATGSFTLPQNGYKKAAVNIATVNLGPRAKVEVQLVNVNEAVDYSLERRGA